MRIVEDIVNVLIPTHLLTPADIPVVILGLLRHKNMET